MVMPEELDEALQRLDARVRALESAESDPWAAQPPTLGPPGPSPALAGPALMPYEDETFPAEIVTDATGGAYTFKEKYRANATTWADLTGGRTGTCYEANKVAGIAVESIVRAEELQDMLGVNFSRTEFLLYFEPDRERLAESARMTE